MARKTVNRKALREEVEAASKAAAAAPAPPAAEAAEAKGAKKKPAKRKSRKEPVEVRTKLFWGVFNQSMKRVALFEYNQKGEADKKALALTQAGKQPHFVQKVKEPIQEP
jgi:hypothetical protein